MSEGQNILAKSMTRRAVLGGGIAIGLASMVPREILAELNGQNASTKELSRATRANLYGFAGENGATTVIALTWQRHYQEFGTNRRQLSEVQLHAGSQSRRIPIAAGKTRAAEWSGDGCRIFAGAVCDPSTSDGRPLDAVVFEAPNWKFAEDQNVEIWAELTLETGTRQRVGSPFLSHLVAQNDALANLYHTGSPADDISRLNVIVKKAIAARADAVGIVADPEEYGRRLVSLLLPDVLRFNPALPGGFTFAGQNGRHPADPSDVVVNSILNGSPASASTVVAFRPPTTFPYFLPHPDVI